MKKSRLSTDKTRVDRYIESAKNHKFLSVLIFGAMILVGFAAVTAAGASLYTLFKASSEVVMSPGPQVDADTIPVHRMYHPEKGTFFYTTSDGEMEEAKQLGWLYEGIGFKAPK